MKFQQESKELEGIQAEKSDCDAFATITNQSYMVHGVGKLDKEKIWYNGDFSWSR